MTPDLFAASSLVWPLCFLLIALLIMRQVQEDVKPIVRGMVGTIAAQSQKNAMMWALGLIYATNASLQALAEVATSFGWVYVAAAAKVLGPAFGAIIAFIAKSPIQTNETPPPLPRA